MNKEILEAVTGEVRKLLEAGSCCKEAKDAAQAWIDAVGTDKESEQAKKLVAELEEDIVTIDGLIAFAGSDMGAKVFGAEEAKKLLVHAESIKAAGAKYCDCPACAACEKILAHKDDLIG